MNLKLPATAVSDRVTACRRLAANERATFANLDGPGCIRHLWVSAGRQGHGREVIIRIYFDGDPVPHVEAPLGDFFGVMHGLPWYPLNTPYLSAQSFSGYNCFFAMPFNRSARVEMERGISDGPVYLFVDWHRFPDQQLDEPRRFCARWRREAPTQRYGENFLLLDADGPGQLLGFVYGVRLYDDVDRWSHGGGDNIYLDGDGEHPAYLRGIGGEDTFGVSFGGALHAPETHLYAGLPYYTHADVGETRPAQRLVGYRFFERDSIEFRSSIHMRFGSMRNDICATSYWYQEGPVRPFFELPDWPLLQPAERSGPPWGELPRGTCDLELPDSGSWWLCGPFGNLEDRAMGTVLEAETEFEEQATFDGMHHVNSPWLAEGSRALGRDVARWVRRRSHHGFVDFNHVFRPVVAGTPEHTGNAAAVARCLLIVERDATASLHLAWDDRLILRVHAGEQTDDVIDLGSHSAFRERTLQVNLHKGCNRISLKLSNTIGSNYCGWAFAFRANLPDGTRLLPLAGDSRAQAATSKRTQAATHS